MAHRIMALLSVGTLISGCFPPESPCTRTYDAAQLLSDIAENRAKWRAQNITAYEYDLDVGCLCGLRSAHISVRDNTVISGRYLDDGSPLEQADLDHYPTVEDLFDYMEGSIKDDYDYVGAEFDRDLGFPTEVTLDRVCDMYDEGIGYQVSDFVVTERSAR